MRRIAIINQKGGVGKTTTAVNLSAALAELGHRVNILDLDPQAHATTHLGIEPDGDRPSIYDVLVRNRPLVEVRREINDRLSLVGSDINLAAAEVELAGVVGREVILRESLERDIEPFDYFHSISLNLLVLVHGERHLVCGAQNVGAGRAENLL